MWNWVLKNSGSLLPVISVSEDYTSGINLPYFTPKLTPQHANYIAAQLTNKSSYVTLSNNRSLHSSPHPSASHCVCDDVPSNEVTNLSCTTCTHEASLNRPVNWSRVDATRSHSFGTKLHLLRNRETHRPAQLRTGFPCQKRPYSVRTCNSIQHPQSYFNNRDMGVHPVNKRSYGSDRRRPMAYLN